MSIYFKSYIYLMLIAFCYAFTLNTNANASDDANQKLPYKVIQALNKANINVNNISVSIENMNKNNDVMSVLNFNAEQLRNPASIMKIVTSVSALEHLGANYTWNTPFYHINSLSQIKNKGIIEDKIYIDLQADPKWIPETTLPMLEKWRAEGIHSIKADFILNNKILAANPDNGLQGDEVYAVKPLADNFAFNSVTLKFNGKDVDFTYPIYGVRIQNNLRTTQAACPSNKSWGSNIQSSIQKNTNYVIYLNGSYSENCQNKTFNVAAIDTMPSKDFLVSSILGLWQSIGGKVIQSPQVSYGSIPKNMHVIGNVYSQKLSDLVQDMNKFSNNLMARLIFLSLGKMELQQGLNANTSKNIALNILNKNRIPTQNMVIENGSGLSYIERISSKQMLAILKLAYTKPYFKNLLLSFPIVGVDGTMKSRLQDISGQAWIKTGTLNNVKSIAGYVDNGSGGYIAITAIINDKNAPLGDVALDELVRWAQYITKN
jgi:serine-type D-Ala-D-Ala carboxypeptidase/endopeptidase (penicillin-binding protein 4)